MDTLLADRKTGRRSATIAWLLAGPIVALSTAVGFCQAPAITISSDVPDELNGSGGGAPNATPEQAAAFAWQEFIALNWPAGPQAGKPGQREAASNTEKFSDPKYVGPLVWQTFRGKVEIFPGNYDNFPIPAPPPGFAGSSDATSFGYDALPVYNYSTPIAACDPNQASDPTPWVNLDETDQILLDNMYAGTVDPNVSRGNSSPSSSDLWPRPIDLNIFTLQAIARLLIPRSYGGTQFRRMSSPLQRLI